MSTRPLRHRAFPVRRRTAIGAALAIGLAVLVLYPGILSIADRIRGVERATLAINASADTVSLGQSFMVSIALDTNGAAVNATGLVAHFDPRSLEIIQMSTVDSFCSFYADNSFDTIRGEVHLSCGTPSPGFSGTSNLVTLTVRALGVGKTTVAIDPDAQVLANDGKGTNVLRHQSLSKELLVKQTF